MQSKSWPIFIFFTFLFVIEIVGFLRNDANSSRTCAKNIIATFFSPQNLSGHFFFFAVDSSDIIIVHCGT